MESASRKEYAQIAVFSRAFFEAAAAGRAAKAGNCKTERRVMGRLCRTLGAAAVGSNM